MLLGGESGSCLNDLHLVLDVALWLRFHRAMARARAEAMPIVMNTSTMKTLIVFVAAAALAAASFAQGTINLSNLFIPPNVDIDNAGSPYTGTFGVEVWGLEATAVPGGINLAPGPGAGVAAYEAMVAQGLRLQATFPDQYMKGGGFTIGAPILPTVGPPEAVIALAFWNTSAPSWASMLASANANTRAGVIAFVNPLADITVSPPLLPAALTGWTRDAVMSSIPEPGELALVGAAVAAFTLCRRPRQRLWPASRHQKRGQPSGH